MTVKFLDKLEILGLSHIMESYKTDFGLRVSEFFTFSQSYFSITEVRVKTLSYGVCQRRDFKMSLYLRVYHIARM